VNDNLMQIARPGSRGHAATPSKTQRLEDSGGVSLRDERRPAMSLINGFVAVRNALIDGRRRRRDYDQLMALDDRSLADIGMHRSQLPAIVEACTGAPSCVRSLRLRSARALRSSMHLDGWLGTARKYCGPGALEYPPTSQILIIFLRAITLGRVLKISRPSVLAEFIG